MSNHQSLYDIPALYQTLPLRLRMVAKAELFAGVPIWAQAMRASGFVELDPFGARSGHRELAARAGRARRGHEHLDRARRDAQQRRPAWSVQVGRLPSGDRRRRAHPASDGLGHARHLTAKGARVIPGAEVQVTVHEPIDPTAFGHEVSDALVEAVRSKIESAL